MPKIKAIKIKTPEDFGKALEAIKHYHCPECLKAGRSGTLEQLSKVERNRLKAMEKDNIPDEIYGCDECKFWIDKNYLETL